MHLHRNQKCNHDMTIHISNVLQIQPWKVSRKYQTLISYLEKACQDFAFHMVFSSGFIVIGTAFKNLWDKFI